MRSHSVEHVPWEQQYPAEKLVPYDPTWLDRYEQIAGALKAALGPEWPIEHVGSTSVPGLVSKPVIDLALGQPPARELDGPTLATLRRLGWSGPAEVGDHRAVFLLVGSVRTAIAHIFTAEQWPEAHPRLFADWLRTHDADREQYARLKGDLVAEGVWGGDYTKAKAAFVLDVVNRSRASRGLPPTDLLGQRGLGPLRRHR